MQINFPPDYIPHYSPYLREVSGIARQQSTIHLQFFFYAKRSDGLFTLRCTIQLSPRLKIL